MSWTLWRLHRRPLYGAVVALAALAVLLLITGLQIASQYRSALAACATTGTCGDLPGQLHLGSPIETALVSLTVTVPGLLGAFWGAPLVARELETGTGRFVWMQSITRRRWLLVATGWALLAAAVWAGAVSALVTWWGNPLNALHQNRFDPGLFDIQNIVPIGYAVFAMALGLATGALLRRMLPAVAVTVAVFTAVRVLVQTFLRPHYLAALTTTFPLGKPSAPAGSAWTINAGMITPDGVTINGGLRVSPDNMPAACQRLLGTGPGHLLPCLGQHGYRQFVSYQPAGRYWTFQGIETGLYLGLAAILVAVTFALVLRREA